MITCRKLAELLVDYVAGELTPELRDHVESHLELCPPCVSFVETYRTTIKLTRQLPPHPLPPHLVARLHAVLCEIQKGEQPPAQA